MKILNINVNDFGGIDHHLEAYKKLYRSGLNEWDKIDKTKEINQILDCIDRCTPDIIIMEEYDINSKEAQSFEMKMYKRGYLLESESPEYKRPSMTIFYIKKDIRHSKIFVDHTKNGRAYAIMVEDIIIYGTHIPPKYDEQFWDELHTFVKKHLSNKYLLIGDFNTINYKNKQEFKKLLDNSIDIWKEKGNPEPISIIGDYAIASKKIDINNIEIFSLDEKYTDHPTFGIVFSQNKPNLEF